MELDREMQMKKAKECGFDGKFGGKESPEDSKTEAREGEHCPMSSTSPAGDQVQAALFSPTSPKEGDRLHHSII